MDLNNITQEVATKDQRELPLYFPPPIYYSLYAAVRLSILLAYPHTHEWFYSNFIQLHFEDHLSLNPKSTDHGLNIFPIEYMKSWYYAGATLFLQEKLIDDKIMAIDRKTLIPLMINWIEKGFYVISRVDVSKLPGTKYYRDKPLAHTVVFYGYDLQKKIFKHFDFNEQGNLVIIEVKFDDYQAAFFSEQLLDLLKAKRMNSKFHISLCNVKSSVKYQLDKECIKSLLHDYRYSVNTTKRYNLFIPEAKGVYGMSVYDAMIKFTEASVQKIQEIDFRAFHALYEHKKVMVARLKHLEKLGVIDLSLQLSDKFSRIEELTSQLRTKVLRYLVVKDYELVNEIKASLKYICDQEIPVIDEIIAGL